MDNYRIQQRKLMGWGEPVPISSFLQRYDLNTIWDLVTRGKLQILNPENRALSESEVADLLNQRFSAPSTSAVSGSENYNSNPAVGGIASQSSGQIETLYLKIAELEGYMETIYDEMQQREADWIQKVEEIQKRVDRQFVTFQKKIDHKISSMNVTSAKRVRPPVANSKEDPANEQKNPDTLNNNDTPSE